MKIYYPWTIVLFLSIIFSGCSGGGFDDVERYSDEQYESDFAMLDDLKEDMLKADDLLAAAQLDSLFIDTEAINAVKEDTLKFVIISKEALEAAHGNGITDDDFKLDQSLVMAWALPLAIEQEPDTSIQEAIHKSYIRHFASDFSKAALFKRNINFDYDKFWDREFRLNKLRAAGDLCLLVFDNWEIELPELVKNEAQSEFYPGYAKATVTCVDLKSQAVLFRFNVLGQNSDEITVTGFYDVGDLQAELGLNDDLFENLISSTREIVSTTLKSENLKKDFKFVFE